MSRERDEVALVWAPSDDLPPTVEPDIGLLIMQFRGSVTPEPIGKIIGAGTVVEPVRVGDGFRVLDHRRPARLLLHVARRAAH